MDKEIEEINDQTYYIDDWVSDIPVTKKNNADRGLDTWVI